MMQVTRRQMLRQTRNGFGALAASAILAAGARSDYSPHHPAKAKNIIFLFMDGGPSQVDTFDPKPMLQEKNGQPFPAQIDATQFDQNGTALASPFKFQAHGQSGLMISELFPHLSKHADRLCVIRSMKSDFAEHSQACMFLHTGHPTQGRPSLGSWINYGLGSIGKNLPSYVVINGGLLPIGGPENFSNAFLPAEYQGTFFNAYGNQEVVSNVTPNIPVDLQRRLASFMEKRDEEFLRRENQISVEDQAIEAAIKNYEVAMSMQVAVPDAINFKEETEVTHRLYGTDSPNPLTAQYAKQCLLARRLVERGVNFVELTCVKGIRFIAPWDDHENLEEGHRKNAAVVDQPIAALISDLEARGLLDSTLIVFAGEFGRTPFAQRGKGRDHNPQGFSIWLAGGGIRGGYCHGATDEFGYRAVSDVVTMHDLHATLLHLMGFDHERLTFRWGGRDYRLTDVYGNVVKACLA